VYIRHGLKRPLEQWLDAMPDITLGTTDSTFGVTHPKGYHVRDLVLEAINHRAPPGVLSVLLAHKPNLSAYVIGSGEYQIGLVRTNNLSCAWTPRRAYQLMRLTWCWDGTVRAGAAVDCHPGS
jgi:hypothetical protein